MSETMIETPSNLDTPHFEQNNVDSLVNLPDAYDPETWPKDLASPLSYIQQISDKIKTFSDEFKETEYSKPGFFKFNYTVRVIHPEGLLEQDYDASSLRYFGTKRHAQQAAAYMFVLNPPEWIAMILGGEKPDYQTYCKKSIEGKIRIDADVDEESLTPEDTSETFSKIEHFTHEEFKEEYSQFPHKFCDIHLDGHIIVKTLKEGTMYPDTNAPLTIAMCVKNQENKIIDQATSLEIRPGEALRYLFWVASNMKIGEEVMAYTTHHNAYGALGLHPLVPPNESLLCFIKVISASPYTMTHDEGEDINDTSVVKRIEQATQCNISGKIFYERKLFKLALDQFESGARRLKLDSKLKELISKPLLEKHTQITCLLRSNIAAVYSNNLFFPVPSSKTLVLSKDALFVQHKIMYNCKGCLKLIPENPKVLYRYSRALLYLQEFEKAKKYRDQARNYVNAKPEEYKGLLRQFEIEARLAKEREALYALKSVAIEKKMGSLFAEHNNDISVKSKSNKAVKNEVTKEKQEELLKQLGTKQNLSEDELLMRRKIKEDIFNDLEENIETVQIAEQPIYEVDNEGKAVHIQNKSIPETGFSQREVLTQTKIDLEQPNQPFVDEKGRVIHGFAKIDYDCEEEEETGEEDGEPKIMFCGDPFEFMEDFIRYG